jgi:hypothetical protein
LFKVLACGLEELTINNIAMQQSVPNLTRGGPELIKRNRRIDISDGSANT